MTDTYNDEVVHTDVVALDKGATSGGNRVSLDKEALRSYVLAARDAANKAKVASEEAALSRDASQANANNASISATNAQDNADRAEQAAIRAEEAADRAEQAGSGGGSSSGGTLDEETLQQINALVDEAKKMPQQVHLVVQIVQQEVPPTQKQVKLMLV